MSDQKKEDGEKAKAYELPVYSELVRQIREVLDEARKDAANKDEIAFAE